MFPTLSTFDNLTAAGILARAAFAIEDGEEFNPAVKFKVPDEYNIRKLILNEARQVLGFSEQDYSEDALSKVGELLDQESDALLAPLDEKATLSSLSDQGHLPSDLFNIFVLPDLVQVYGSGMSSEEDKIRETIKNPDQEENLEPSSSTDMPFMISLFSKTYKNKFPFKNFTMLVAGQRNGLDFIVHQAWRVYHSLVNIDGAKTLVDLLGRFAETYGHEVELGGKKGKLIYSTEIPQESEIKSSVTIFPEFDKNGKQEANSKLLISLFTQPFRDKSNTQAALVLAINIIKYNKAISGMK